MSCRFSEPTPNFSICVGNLASNEALLYDTNADIGIRATKYATRHITLSLGIISPYLFVICYNRAEFRWF
ncbi:hypothetical protein ACN38_g7683 [Penicillium nordicum]|uniref:Uncharacterized protein n=1 Tax=Penicillium nordicum TaxID=229535 RepID=A0A0M9WE66_9EURO|nr:hypothetical protein ACN38_g7683 [Penicillium nordicum]